MVYFYFLSLFVIIIILIYNSLRERFNSISSTSMPVKSYAPLMQLGGILEFLSFDGPPLILNEILWSFSVCADACTLVHI